MIHDAARDDSSIDPGIVQRASLWMARLWSDEASAADRAACAAWRAAHADHERAWQRLRDMEEQLVNLPRRAARRVLLEAPPARAARRAVMRTAVLALLAGGTLYTVRRSDTWQLATADYATGTGEIRDIVLPDQTRLVLDTRSAVDVRYTQAERAVLLRTGRVHASTAADPAPWQRPFFIECPAGVVQTRDAHYSVRRVDGGDGLAEVAVYQGEVDVIPRHGSARRLSAGLCARFSDTAIDVAQPLPDATEAWIRGTLVAEHMRVIDFLAELARYRSGLLRADPALGNLRVTGVFPLGDTDRALANLAQGLPVDVRYRTRYWVTVAPRTGKA